VNFGTGEMCTDCPGLNTNSAPNDTIVFEKNPTNYIIKVYDVNINVNALPTINASQLVSNPQFTTLNSVYDPVNISSLNLDYIPGHIFPKIF